MNDFPDKITRIEILKLDKASKKICNCNNFKYTVDSTNRLVYCDCCGAVVEPFKAIENLAIHTDRLSSQLESIFEQKKKILNYKPHLEIFKNMEYNYTHGKIPYCPHCNKMFDFKEIYYWGNVLFYETRKKDNQN